MKLTCPICCQTCDISPAICFLQVLPPKISNTLLGNSYKTGSLCPRDWCLWFHLFVVSHSPYAYNTQGCRLVTYVLPLVCCIQGSLVSAISGIHGRSWNQYLVDKGALANITCSFWLIHVCFSLSLPCIDLHRCQSDSNAANVIRLSIIQSIIFFHLRAQSMSWCSVG